MDLQLSTHSAVTRFRNSASAFPSLLRSRWTHPEIITLMLEVKSFVRQSN